VYQYENDTDMKDDLAAHCPIARSLQIVGDAWSVLILRDAFMGLTRFDQFRKSLGIAPTMLTSRLATMTEAGLLEKRRYMDRPPRDEYVLSSAGRDFLPVLIMLGAWGKKHRSGGDLTRYVDAETGKEIVPIAVDLETGARIGTRPINMIDGQSGLAGSAPIHDGPI
jgi:DNA-binding HxlR family transcriptional regulator